VLDDRLHRHRGLGPVGPLGRRGGGTSFYFHPITPESHGVHPIIRHAHITIQWSGLRISGSRAYGIKKHSIRISLVPHCTLTVTTNTNRVMAGITEQPPPGRLSVTHTTPTKLAGLRRSYIPRLRRNPSPRQPSHKPNQTQLGLPPETQLTYRITTLWRTDQGRFVMIRLVCLTDRDTVEEHHLVV